MYADDIILLSHSAEGLQDMLFSSSELFLQFNSNKFILLLLDLLQVKRVVHMHLIILTELTPSSTWAFTLFAVSYTHLTLPTKRIV